MVAFYFLFPPFLNECSYLSLLFLCFFQYSFYLSFNYNILIIIKNAFIKNTNNFKISNNVNNIKNVQNANNSNNTKNNKDNKGDK